MCFIYSISAGDKQWIIDIRFSPACPYRRRPWSPWTRMRKEGWRGNYTEPCINIQREPPVRILAPEQQTMNPTDEKATDSVPDMPERAY